MIKLYLLAWLAAIAASKNSYIVLCPTTIRPGVDFEVNVHILKSTGDVRVKLELTKISSRTSIASSESCVPQGYPTGISLKIPAKMESGSYQLRVTGSGGLAFSDQTYVILNKKSMSLFLQTDKAMYKPSQTVNFRAFGLYLNLCLYSGEMKIEIFDSKSNKIKQWTDIQTVGGVYTNQLPLSDQPVLGDWKIKVTAGNMKHEQVFTVAEYVLPKYEVTVSLPQYSLTTNNGILVKIKARYTYGKSVKGTVCLEAKLDRYHRTIIKTTKIKGETEIFLPMKQIKTLSSYLNHRKLWVFVNVTEELTGKVLNGTSSVRFYSKAEKVEFLKSCPQIFKPGLIYTAYIKVSQPDGRPVVPSNCKIQLKIRITINRSSYYLPSKRLTVPDNGLAVVGVDIPQNATSVYMTATYKHAYSSKSISKSHSPSNSYIQVSIMSSQISAGSYMSFNVKSTQPFDVLVYQILSRGSIVKMDRVVQTCPRKNTFFNLQVMHKMAPSARMIVYYVRADGEVVVDSISFDVEGAFENKVSIMMSKTEAKPGDRVGVMINSEPYSHVHLLAVDQSVLLLKSGNDITQTQVLDELKNYDMPKVYNGGSDASKLLKNAGVLIMTDAIVYRYSPPPRRYCGWYGCEEFMTTTTMPRTMGMTMPMTMPMLLDGNSVKSVVPLKKVDRIRSVFPETWMWLNATADFGGRAMFDTTVPDTITSWVATAFAVSDTKGFGVTPGAANLKVFRPFFVSLNLPYSVTRGEQVILQVLVFNYLKQDVNVVVTLPKCTDYSNIIIGANGVETTVSQTQVDNIRVKAEDSRSVYFPIIPLKLGYIDIQVSGQTKIAADGVKRQILVEPEGILMEYNQPVLVDLKKTNLFSKTVPITFPANVVDGSQRVVVTAVGDLMGPSLKGLERLLRMPFGCGEQTMITFAPNVFIVNYLKATKQYDGQVIAKALRFMETGYQRELTYMHRDGSFSAFGDRDRSGSMWLTAFVVKTFHQAKSHIFIDDKLMVRAINWMIKAQNRDGSFSEVGRVIHKNMQGGSASGASLTAFVLISLLENKNLSYIQTSVKRSIDRAVTYLESKVNTIGDDYTLAITCYALKLAQSSLFSVAFNKLKAKAIVKDGLRHWHKPQTKPSSTHYWNPPCKSNAIDTEMTSYVLLIYAELNGISGLDIMKWVIAQRNPHGGFASTQDTVVALQALSLFAKMVYSDTFDIQVNIRARTFTKSFSINKQNALVLQSVDLPNIPNKIQITATGHGLIFVEVAVFFNVIAEVEEPSFELTVKIEEETVQMLTINTCARWLHNGSSGMAVQEIGVPSGFTADKRSIGFNAYLKRIDSADKKIILYFDEIGQTAMCVNVELHRTGLVVKTQPVAVTVYDYYEPSNKAVAFYQSTVLKKSRTCDVCPNCSRCDAKQKQK